MADSMSLGENFGRADMHPLDEAEAFAKLATSDGKDANAIAAEFGCSKRYIRQRMILANLAEPVKAAYRQDQIDTATAEAFASVPADKQLEVWREVNGNPRHADHVRNMIAHGWIDAADALFELTALPESVVSRDLFGDRVLIMRQAFMAEQIKALENQRQTMVEQGWSAVVLGQREDVQDQLYALQMPQREFDPVTAKKLGQLEKRKQKLEEAVEKLNEDDGPRFRKLQLRLEQLDVQEQQIIEQAPPFFSEETKAVATAYLILDPDGRVHPEYRIPRPSKSSTAVDSNGNAVAAQPQPPKLDQLTDKQLAETFAHQALAVRLAVLKSPATRKRLLAMILHEKVRSEALAVRHEANITTLHASADGFRSSVFDRLSAMRAKLEPLTAAYVDTDVAAYNEIDKLSAAKLDALIDLLIVGAITAHPVRATELVQHLTTELEVNVRADWHPDTSWLSGFQKIQLAELVVELKGAVHAPAADRKKSDLVAELDRLFADAAEGKLADEALALRCNQWLPFNLHPQPLDNAGVAST